MEGGCLMPTWQISQVCIGETVEKRVINGYIEEGCQYPSCNLTEDLSKNQYSLLEFVEHCLETIAKRFPW